jgi:predicted helicase
MVDNRVFYSNKGIPCLFPLYLYPAEGEMQLDGGCRRPNLNPEFIKAFSAKLELKFVEDGKGDLQETFGPEDIFNYAYAVFHSPEYRARYEEFLKIDFPRLPLTADKALFKSLAEKGGVLVSLHLMESPLLNNLITRYEVKGEHAVEKVSYDEITLRVAINKTQYFEGVPTEVWNFHVGGYQVCEKWLKDRKGRKLTIDDIGHYQKIVVALKETIRLMNEIDEVINEHGGWPGAFQ